MEDEVVKYKNMVHTYKYTARSLNIIAKPEGTVCWESQTFDTPQKLSSFYLCDPFTTNKNKLPN